MPYTFDPSTDVADLTGKVAIVTGGNSGMGLEIVKALARNGAKVYLAARNRQKGLDAIEHIKAAGLSPGNGEVELLELDLAAPKLAKAAAERFLKEEERLDILVNNAAVMMIPYNIMPEGVQEVVTTNYLSHFTFTRTLLPLLAATAKQPNSDVRIVNVSSRAHRFLSSGVQFRTIDDLNHEYNDYTWPEMTRYGLSKLAIVLWTKKLQRQFDAEGVPVTAISLHPGEVSTEGAHTLVVPWFLRPIYRFILLPLAFVPPQKGIYTSLFAAAGKHVKEEPEKYRGAFLDPVAQLSEPSSDSLREDLADDLWKLTNQVLKDAGVL